MKEDGALPIRDETLERILHRFDALSTLSRDPAGDRIQQRNLFFSLDIDDDDGTQEHDRRPPVSDVSQKEGHTRKNREHRGYVQPMFEDDLPGYEGGFNGQVAEKPKDGKSGQGP